MNNPMAVPYWRLSGFYFFYFAALGCYIPYWGLYLKDSGLTSQEIGELSAWLVATKIISPNLGGWLADHTGKGIRIIRLTSFFAALLFCGFVFTHHYFWFAVTTIAFSFFWNAVLPQFEAATLFHLRNNSHRYSQIRLWGSIGFILTVLGTGWLLDKHPIKLLPFAIITLLIFNWWVSLITPDAKKNSSKPIILSIGSILKKPEVIAFFTVNIFIQIAHSPYYVFYSIYLKNHHYSATLTGLLWALGVFAEIILFIYMKNILKYFSLRTILLLSILLSSGRWLIVGWYPDFLSLLIVAQILHAASFGGTHIVAIHLVHLYFGEQHQGKGQALYSSLSFGLGGVIGSLYSGYFWQLLGSKMVFSLAAGICIIAFVITYVWTGRENKKNFAVLG